MLNFLGTLGGNIIGLPGIVGLALGMLTRRWWLAAILGALVGAVSPLMFANWHWVKVAMLDQVLAVIVGIVAALIGCLIRRKGARV